MEGNQTFRVRSLKGRNGARRGWALGLEPGDPVQATIRGPKGPQPSHWASIGSNGHRHGFQAEATGHRARPTSPITRWALAAAAELPPSSMARRPSTVRTGTRKNMQHLLALIRQTSQELAAAFR